MIRERRDHSTTGAEIITNILLRYPLSSDLGGISLNMASKYTRQYTRILSMRPSKKRLPIVESIQGFGAWNLRSTANHAEQSVEALSNKNRGHSKPLSTSMWFLLFFPITRVDYKKTLWQPVNLTFRYAPEIFEAPEFQAWPTRDHVPQATL